MAKPEQPQTGDGTVGLSGTQTLSGRSPRFRLRPEFVHPECTNIELPLWSGRGLCVDEDSGTSWEKSPGCQARVSAAWMHKQYGIALWAERFGQGQRGPAAFRLCNLVAQSRLKKVGCTAFSSPRSAGVEGSAFASSTGPEWWPLSQCAPAFSSCLRGLNRRYELILRGTRFNDSPFSMSRVLLVPGA